MPKFLGTRTSSRQPNSMPATRQLTRDFGQQDPGSLNQATLSLTFAAAGATITGSPADFANFAISDRFEVENTVTNDGGYQVTGIDGVNQAYVTVAPPPSDEGPISAFLRKIT